jgi:hypothetical protein
MCLRSLQKRTGCCAILARAYASYHGRTKTGSGYAHLMTLRIRHLVLSFEVSSRERTVFISISISERLYRMSRDIMSILQNLIPEVISCQKNHMNIGPILNGCGAINI